MEDEYELLPQEEVSHLKAEIERLKDNSVSSGLSGSEILEAINRLNASVQKLYALFRSVNDDIIREYREGGDESAKLDKIIEQNHQIAEGILSLAKEIHEPASPSTQNSVPQENLDVPGPIPTNFPNPATGNYAPNVSKSDIMDQYVPSNFPQNERFPPMPEEHQQPIVPRPEAQQKKKFFGMFRK